MWKIFVPVIRVFIKKSKGARNSKYVKCFSLKVESHNVVPTTDNSSHAILKHLNDKIMVFDKESMAALN